MRAVSLQPVRGMRGTQVVHLIELHLLRVDQILNQSLVRCDGPSAINRQAV
jgi:hypothetical protein